MQWYLTRHAAMQQDDGTADLPAADGWQDDRSCAGVSRRNTRKEYPSSDRGKQQDRVGQMAGQEAKYQKIINWVRQEIADGSLRSGDKLPSEKELSERFGLSRQTVRHATGELEAQHIVSRVQGSGPPAGL